MSVDAAGLSAPVSMSMPTAMPFVCHTASLCMCVMPRPAARERNSARAALTPAYGRNEPSAVRAWTRTCESLCVLNRTSSPRVRRPARTASFRSLQRSLRSLVGGRCAGRATPLGSVRMTAHLLRVAARAAAGVDDVQCACGQRIVLVQDEIGPWRRLQCEAGHRPFDRVDVFLGLCALRRRRYDGASASVRFGARCGPLPPRRRRAASSSASRPRTARRKYRRYHLMLVLQLHVADFGSFRVRGTGTRYVSAARRIQRSVSRSSSWSAP